MEGPKKFLQHLIQLELQADGILGARDDIVAMDRLRNDNREALRAVEKQPPDQTTAWFAVGPLFVEMPREHVTTMLSKEQVRLDTVVGAIRSELKVGVSILRDMEEASPIPGIKLKSLSRAEMNAVGQAIGRRTE